MVQYTKENAGLQGAHENKKKAPPFQGGVGVVDGATCSAYPQATYRFPQFFGTGSNGALNSGGFPFTVGLHPRLPTYRRYAAGKEP